jgi:hypothetical protein
MVQTRKFEFLLTCRFLGRLHHETADAAPTTGVREASRHEIGRADVTGFVWRSSGAAQQSQPQQAGHSMSVEEECLMSRQEIHETHLARSRFYLGNIS